jgi:lysyl endopeptidase
MSTWIWRKSIILLCLAVEVLAACALPSASSGTENAVTQTPGIDVDNKSSQCRVRNEIPLADATSLRLPEIDVQALREQDQDPPKDAPLRFATSAEVNIDPASYGKWEITDATIQVWRLRIISPRALSLSLGFTSFNMPAQGCLFVYLPDQSLILGPYTHDDNEEHGQLWTPTVDGEEVIIEISIPKDQISQLQLVLGFVNQGYKK